MLSLSLSLGLHGLRRRSAAPADGYLSAGTLAKASAIHATRKLVSSYNGPAYRLIRVSDNAELDIGFIGQSLDWAAASAFIGASSARVMTWYDQSGNGYDLTQGTAASRPVCNVRGRTGEQGGVGLWTTGGTAHMAWPAGLSTDGRNVSVLQVFRTNDRAIGNDAGHTPTFQLGTGSTTGCILYNGSTSTVTPTPALMDRRLNLQAGIGGAFRTSASIMRAPNTALTVSAFRSLTTGISIRQGWKAVTAAAGNAFSGPGGTWGRSFGSSFYSASCEGHSIIVATGYTDSEESAARAELAAIYSGANTSPTNLLVWDGDSISAGYLAATANDERETSPSYLFRTNVGPTWEVHNRAWAGGSITSGQVKDRVSPAADGIDPILDLTQFTGRKICVMMIGSNDISLGTADATVLSRAQAYYDARVAAGWGVWMCNIIPRQSFTGAQETSRLAINAGYASQFGSQMIDVAGAVDWTDASYATYMQDGTHPNAAGVAVIEATVRADLTP